MQSFKPFEKDTLKGSLLKAPIILLSVGLFLLLLFFWKNPTEVLSFKFEWFCIVAVVLIVLAGLLQVIVARLRVTSKWVMGASIAVSAGLFICFVLFVVGFQRNIGVISIKSEKQLDYLNNYKYGSYCLEKDFDLKGEEIGFVNDFTGRLDGKGHKIKNLKVQKHSFITDNKGTVENLTFEAAEIMYPLFDTNNGKIERVTISGAAVKSSKDTPKQFGILVKENSSKGIINACSVTACAVTGQHTAQQAAVEVERTDFETFSGICGENVGTITDSQVSGLAGEMLSVKNFGGICGVSGNKKHKGTVSGCSVTDLKLTVVTSGLFGGISAGGTSSYTDCAVNGVLNSYIRRASDWGGIVPAVTEDGRVSNCDVSLKATIGILSCKEELAIGGVAGLLKNGARVECCSVGGDFAIMTAYRADGTECPGLDFGGVVGQASGYETVIKNCYSTANQSFTHNWGETVTFVRLSGIFGTSLDNSTEEKKERVRGNSVSECFASGKISTTYDAVNSIGGITADPRVQDQPHFKNCFFVGSLSKVGRYTDGYITGQAGENVYYSDIIPEGTIKLSEDAVAMPQRDILKSDFIYDKLGFSKEVWSVTDGKLPVFQRSVVDKEE